MAEQFKEGLDLLDYTDFFYKGFQVNTPFVVKQVEAIKNALKLYLFSKVGDYGRNLSKGGPLFGFIGKPLDETSKSQLEQAIYDVLAVYSNIVVQSINVVADKENKKWSVRITFSDTYNKFTDTINFDMG